MTLKQQLPELNQNQWAMLERLILECLPNRVKLSRDAKRYTTLKHRSIGHNSCIESATQSITKLFKEEVMTCNVCKKQYTSPSLGGAGICPSCDCGIPPIKVLISNGSNLNYMKVGKS